MKQKIKILLQQYFSVLPAFLLTLLLMRGMEFFRIKEISFRNEIKTIIFPALISDGIFFLKIIPVLFLIFLITCALKKKIAFHILTVFIAIWLMIYAALIAYFTTSHVPLGADMFGYSVKGLGEIIWQSLDFSAALMLLFILPLLFFRLTLWVFKDLNLGGSIFTALLILSGTLLTIFSVSAIPDPARFSNDFTYNTAQNKGAFFIEKLAGYFTKEGNTAGAKGRLTHQKTMRSKFLNPAYPFLKEENTPDALGPFFNISPVPKPNFVFIQVEGLGRAFSGPNAYLGSFTPFLDELAQKSIYFKNFLSAQGRTFASLPSILGSLPFAQSGFNDLGEGMPAFHSFISIVRDNGYSSTFYGGFEMDFDNQGMFMKNAGIGKIISAADFDPSLKMGSPIGYADHDLLLKTFGIEAKNTSPFLSYIQTISMHNPFTIPDQQKYLRLFEARMKSLGMKDPKKEAHRLHRNIFASIMYTDAALRQFFESYSKLPAFKNTIFVITGDHRLPEIPLSTKIDRYHVPLIIYSPMLKHPASISSISSHLDITPSLTAFLRENYHFKTPSKVTWTGDGLDMESSFRNVHSYPLKQGKTVLHNFIHGPWFVDEGRLFNIKSDMDLIPVTHAAKLEEINTKFEEYRTRNNQFIETLRLKP